MYIFHELAFIAVLFFAGHFFRVFEHEFRRAAAETKAIAAPGTTPCHRIIIQGSARILFALLIKSRSTDFEKGLNPTNGRIPDTSRSTALSDDDRRVISSRITTGRRPIATALKVHEVYLRSIRLLTYRVHWCPTMPFNFFWRHWFDRTATLTARRYSCWISC